MRNLWFILTALFLALLSLPAQADGGNAITISGAWVRAVPPVSQNSVAFLRIHNSGKQDDALLSVASSVAGAAELHDMVMSGGVMRMDKLAQARVPAGGDLVLDPDSKHLMLLGLKAPLKIGQQVSLSLHFRRAGVVNILAVVKSDMP